MTECAIARREIHVRGQYARGSPTLDSLRDQRCRDRPRMVGHEDAVPTWTRASTSGSCSGSTRALCRARAAEARGLATATDLSDALGSPDVDAVILCTPHRLHAEQIVAAAEAGKHVFCEKPLTTNVDEAKAAIEAVTAAGVQLGIGHERRFEPAVDRVARAVPLGSSSACRWCSRATSARTSSSTCRRTTGGCRTPRPRSVRCRRPASTSSTWRSPSSAGRSRCGRGSSTQATAFANGDTLTITMGFEQRRDRADHRDPDHAVRRPRHGARLARRGSRSATATTRSDPMGWDVTTVRRGAEPATKFHPPHAAVRDNLEEFARAAEGLTTYPVQPRGDAGQRRDVRGDHAVRPLGTARTRGMITAHRPGRRREHM